MRLSVESPTKAFIEDISDAELQVLTAQLTYNNTANQHKLKRHYNNVFWRNKNRDSWEAELEKLKKSVKHTLIFEENGRKYIRPGSIPYLIDIGNIQVVNKIQYPTPKKVPWAKPLPFELHPYQEISWQRLIEEKHAHVELCTAAGKSAILQKLCRETGFKSAIVAPSRSIFRELLASFEKHLGKNQVGAYGDGKKKIGKRFTICIADSIANIKPGTPEWEFFSTMEALYVDESHTWGAETLDEQCHGIFANVPFRAFFSGTQTRGDGAEKLLWSIIGKNVYTLTTKEAIQKGYIGKHDFIIFDVESSNPNFYSKDALDMKRTHFLDNRNIAAIIAKFINSTAELKGEQSLVLVEELDQISMLIKLLKVPYVYAHSETKKERLLELGLEKVDTAESVEKFNKNQAKVLIGTSCIATGTNIYPQRYTFNWVGGASEIKTKQGPVGRSSRKGEHNPWAELCIHKDCTTIVDFNVYDIEVMQKHLEDRISYYMDSGTEIRRINLNAKKQASGGPRQ